MEGIPAGGSARTGRDKETQAALPLRGKVLNAWEVERDLLFNNNEIHDISVAIGVDPHGPNVTTPDLSRAALRQGLHPVRTRTWTARTSKVLLLTLSSATFPS